LADGRATKKRKNRTRAVFFENVATGRLLLFGALFDVFDDVADGL
jgi:hypothetical protein